MADNFFAEAAGEAKRIPWWGWVVGGGAVLLFGSHLLNRQPQVSAAADAGGVTDTSGGSGSVGDIGTPGPPPTSGGASDTSRPQVPDAPQLGAPPLPTVRNEPPPSGAAPAPAAAPAQPAVRTYTVKSGDTLADIGARYHVDWQTIYALNAGTIEATARAHSFGSSDHGHWIFPGEVLKIPAA